MSLSKVVLPNIDQAMLVNIDQPTAIPWYKFFEGVYNRLTTKITGWTASTGTPNKGAYATYAGQTMAAGYTQAQVQALDDAAKALSQRVKALEDAMRAQGMIN